MNFQNITAVESSKAYLDKAFRKAREKSEGKKLKGEWLSKTKSKSLLKLQVVRKELVGRLEQIIKEFPHLGSLPLFYQELVRLTLDYGELKKAFGGVHWATGKIKFFYREYARKIARSRENKGIKAGEKEFYGRISSVVKQIEQPLAFLDESRRVMRNYPDVKEMFTVVIFGFPNVGKTTLLNGLTGAKGKVAEYAFTTQGVNSGFMEIGDKKIQVLDVPGTLARVEKMNNLEKIAYLAVRELAGMVVYVFDLSEGSYELNKQEELFSRLREEKGEKKVLVYLSKRDLLQKGEAEEFEEKWRARGVEVLELEGLKKEMERLA